MFFRKQKLEVKQLKLNKFIFDVKQLKMSRFIISISDLIRSKFNLLYGDFSIKLNKKVTAILVGG